MQLCFWCSFCHRIRSRATGYVPRMNNQKEKELNQEIIDWICKELKLTEQTNNFLQQMRDYRNRIAYEGFTVHKNYIQLNSKEIIQLIESFISDINKNLN